MKKIYLFLTIMSIMTNFIYVNAQTTIYHPRIGAIHNILDPGIYYYYDDGGPSGNYSDNINNTTLSLVPRQGCKLNYHVVEYEIEDNGFPICYDFLRVSYVPCGGFAYSNEWCSSNQFWGDALCYGEGIQFNFTSDVSVTESGWFIIITVEEKTPENTICTVESSCTPQISNFYTCGIESPQQVNYLCPVTCTGGIIDAYPGCSSTLFKGAEKIFSVEVLAESDLTFTTSCIDHLFLINESCFCEQKATKIGNEYTFKKVPPGHYYVVAEYTCNSCSSSVKLKCKDICVPYEKDCGIGGPIYSDYTGNGTSLTYKFTSNVGLAPGEQWLVKDENGTILNNKAGTAQQISFTFPRPGSYYVCFPTLDANKCLYYCCYHICCQLPFTCDWIRPRYFPSSNSFSFDLDELASTGGTGYEEWKIGDNFSNAVPFDSKNFKLPLNWNCVEKVVCCRFFNYGSNCWDLCCRRVWICNPFQCDAIDYTFSPSQNKYVFSFIDSTNKDYSNFKWVVDSTDEILLGNKASASWYPPIGSDCKYYTISFTYHDAKCNCWRICCKTIYFCNPINCSFIKPRLVPSQNGIEFTLDQNLLSNANVLWKIDETGEILGTTKTILYKPNPLLPCKIYTVSVKYWDGFGWQICCLKINICNPTRCSGNINTSYKNGFLTLSTNPNYSSESWFINQSDNPIPNIIQLSPGIYTFDLFYFDKVNKNWDWCRKDPTKVDVSDNKENNLIVAPNPLEDIMYIYNLPILRNVKIQLISDIGNIIYPDWSYSGDIIEAKIKSVPNGIYILRLECNDQVILKKICITHR